jgi:hypothetical protein
LNTSDGQQQKLLRDMRALIDDFARDDKGFPPIQDFTERLGITKMTVIKYKKRIMNEDTKSLLEIFGTKRIENVKDTVKVLEENINFNKEIRDDDTCTKSERMQAAENMEKSHLRIAEVMHDAPEYLYNNDELDNNNDSKEKHSDRPEETRTDETTESVLN